jgi:two-component system sensor histidine kinase/response regulator
MTFSSPAVSGHILQVDEGLQRLMGDGKLYLQILRRFRRSHHDAAGRTRQASEDGDHDGAMRIIHTLKGAAGMVGAQQVYLGAITLECAAPDEWMQALARLETALEETMHIVDHVLDDVQRNAARAEADAAAQAAEQAKKTAPATRILLLHLARLLEEGDGAAIDVLEQSATL